MFDPHTSMRRTATCMVLSALVLLWPWMSAASSKSFSEADLDQAEPVEIASRIMSIDYATGILVIAETRVLIVNVVMGGERFTTQVIDADDEAISFDELIIGQTVLVQGLKLADGRVVGVKVQQQ